MRRYFISISYKGSNYRGWQRQPNVVSVQESLELHLSNLNDKKIALWGCGRTDAGVHARTFYAHFDSEKQWNSEHVFYLNKSLPGDIVIRDIFEVDSQAHAQHDVISRTYSYHLHFNPNPFLSELSTLYEGPSMQTAPILKTLDFLKGNKDFSIFCKNPSRYRHTICRMSEAKLYASQEKWRMEFTANRFLKGMVRLIVARLIEIGQEKMTPQQFQAHQTYQKPFRYQWSAYPQGLFLDRVEYPKAILLNSKGKT